MVFYFAYGSNLLLSQIRERIANPILKPVFVAYMPDKILFFPRESTKQKEVVASYKDKQGHKLWGGVFDLTGEEFNKMDKCEGYEKGRKNNSYEKINVVVIKVDKTKEEVDTYLANIVGDFLPSQYYMNKLIRGAQDCHLPDYYIEELKHIETNGID